MGLPAHAKISQELLNQETPEAKVTVEKGHFSIVIGKQNFVISEPIDSDSARIHFDSMSAKDQEKFQTKRRNFLAKAARALSLMKYGFGMGSIVKEKIIYQFGEIKSSMQMNRMRHSDPGTYQDFIAATDRTLEARILAREQKAALSLKDRSNQITSSFLKGIDMQLWQQAPLFVNSNEFGVVASAGLELLAGKREKGWGGILELGISIGYNSKERSLIFQIVNNREAYKSSPLPVFFLTGATVKLGGYIANQRPGELTRKGLSYYPPIVPGYSSTTKDSFATGFSTGLTWPPSPLGDLLTYTDKLSQTTLLRISISPIQKGFIRIGTGFNPMKWMTTLVSVKEAIANFGKKNSIAASCSGLF